MATKKKNPHYDTVPPPEAPKEKVVELDPAVKFVKDEWQKYNEYWGSRLSDFDHYYDLWKGNVEERTEDWMSTHNKKLIFQDERALTARFHSLLFPSSAPIDADPTEDVDEISAIVAKSIVSHYFKIGDAETVKSEFLDMIRSAGIYGTGYGECEWYIKKGWVYFKGEIEEDDFRSMVGPDGNPLLDEEGRIRSQSIGKKKVFRDQKKYALLEDRPRLKSANIFGWRVHPRKLSVDDEYPTIKQEFVSYETILEMQEEYKRIGVDLFDEEAVKSLKEMKEQISQVDYERHMKGGGFKDYENPEIELKHYWGLYALSNQDGKPRKVPAWITIANDRLLLRKIQNPHWHQRSPLVKIFWMKDPKPSWYGIGLAEIGEASEARVNEIIRTRSDNLKKIINKSLSYDANDPKINKRLLQTSKPGVARPCSAPGKSIVWDDIPDVTQSSYVEEEKATQDHRDQSGATVPLVPPSNPKEEKPTLGQSELAFFGANERLKPDLWMMELHGIRMVANRFYMLIRQFSNKESLIEINASQDERKQFMLEEMMRVDPRRLTEKVDFYCTGLSETIEKSEMIDKLLKFKEIVREDPTVNQMEINKRLATLMGFPDVEELIQPQMMMGGQGQGGQPPMPPIAPTSPMAQQMPIPPAGLPASSPFPGQGMPPPPTGPMIPGAPPVPPELLAQLTQAMGQGIPPEVLLAQLNQGGM